MSYLAELPYEEPISVYRESDSTGPGYNSTTYESYGRTYHSNAVVLHVSMCCEKCTRKVRKSLTNVDGVDSVEVDMPRQRVIVRGYVNPDKVLRQVQKVKKSAQFWDSSHDYATYSNGAAYDSPYDYYRPAASGAAYEPYDFNSRSQSYDFNYGYMYPSSYDYPGYSDQHYRSYDAY
ncbi:unnamed protein product [Calypogeia fissa]